MRHRVLVCFGILLSAFCFGQGKDEGKDEGKDSLQTRIILIGDAGSLIKGSPSVLNAVKQSYPLTENTVVLFLGDNLYDGGLPDETYRYYSNIKAALDSELHLITGTKATAIMIPGNHDWKNGGADGYATVIRQQAYVDRYGEGKVRFFPKDGCPGPVEIPINDKVVLVVMDSQWWLHTKEKPGIESDCPYKTEDEVITELEDILNKNYKKLVILATHHPFKSNGPHGGYYTWKQHIFPFTDMNKKLYIPLPILGSIYPITRSVFGTTQDIKNPNYQNMINRITAAVKTHPHVIMVAGHEHNLQLAKDSNYFYLVSGAGCKTNRVSPGRKALFTATELGFATLDINKNQNVYAHFYTVYPGKADSLDHKYSTFLFNYGKLPELKKEDTVQPKFEYKDFVVAPASSQYKSINGLKKFFNGSNYRKEWSVPVTLKVFNLNKEKGGFKIDGLGGGKQTKSLSLIDKNGEKWALRTIDKDPDKALPENLRGTFASGIVQDMISAGHPYAPLTMPDLTNAAGIIESYPEFFYVPDDPALGYYRPLFANKVCLLEQKDPDYTKDSKSSYKIFDKMREENDNTVDQYAVLNARLFDMLVGDWDRHFDQWKFAPRDTGKGKTYVPVPRDRDQAFFNSDGFLIKYLSVQRLRFMKGFTPKFKDINGLNVVAKDFDRLFLTGIDRHQWDSITAHLVSALNDSVIIKAVKKLPPEVYAIRGQKITRTLMGRRDDLQRSGARYYNFLSKEVNVLGSNQKELFKVEQDGKNMKVIVYSWNKKGDTSFILYKRSFDPAVTKEIRLYGFNGDDQFLVDTSVHSRIKLRIIGGNGNDTFTFKSKVKSYVYDNSTQKNYISSRFHVRKFIENDPAINEYKLRGFNYRLIPLPKIQAGFNSDDGILLGLGMLLRSYQFRKEPFANEQKITAITALHKQSFQVKYNALFIHLLRKTDVLINARIDKPTITNFFGFGNNNNLDTSQSIRHYIVRYSFAEGDLLFRQKKFDKISVYAGPSVYIYHNEQGNNADYVLAKPSSIGLDSVDTYTDKSYAGFKGGIDLDNLNNDIFPTRGIKWTSQFTYLKGLTENTNSLTKLQSDMVVYASLKIPAKVIGVIKMGGAHIFNDSIKYFQAVSLGQNNILRGFRKNRFSGSSVAYGSLELRIKLFDSKSYLLPGQVGLVLFDDIGRVWYANEKSKKWHNTYGAGLYVIPFNLTIVSATIGLSEDGKLFNFSFGTKFNLTF